MTFLRRSRWSLSSALAVLSLTVIACGGDDDDSGTAGAGGSSGTSAGSAGTATVGGSAGTTSTGGKAGTTSTGGKAGTTSTGGTAGTTSTGGSAGTTSAGGAAGTTSAGGAAGTTSTGGTAGTTSTGGTAGTTSAGGASAGDGGTTAGDGGSSAGDGGTDSGGAAGSTQVPSAVATKVATGDLSACALTNSGSVKCWGYNDQGQLGIGSDDEHGSPTAVVLDGLKAKDISMVNRTACAITTAGGVVCWGDNPHGQLGNNSTSDSDKPVAVSGLTSGVKAIAVGYTHVCAVTDAGGVKCWGDNSGGKLGNGQESDGGGTENDAHTPVDVMGLSSGAVAVAVGRDHSCAVLATGGVKCWGLNGDKQLGSTEEYNGTFRSLTPVDVPGLAGAVSITASWLHTCVLTTAGGIKCWGTDDDGQLGNGKDGTIVSYVPGDVVGLTSGVVSVSAGGDSTCAVTTAGAVKCWGSNAEGKLGQNKAQDKLSNSTTPLDVTGLTSGYAAAVVGNGDYACALSLAGAIKCWGANDGGQLGDGTTDNHLLPTSVVGFP